MAPRIKDSVAAAMRDVSAAARPVRDIGQKVVERGIVVDLSELGGLIGKLLGENARITIMLPE